MRRTASQALLTVNHWTVEGTYSYNYSILYNYISTAYFLRGFLILLCTGPYYDSPVKR